MVASLMLLENNPLQSGHGATSLLNFIYYFGEEAEKTLNASRMFQIIGDSYLTTFLLLFLSSWILSILVGLGRSANK